MATIQSGIGRVSIFEDFLGPEDIIAETAASRTLGKFRVVGQASTETDAGITIDESTIPLNGVCTLITDNADKATTGLATSKAFEAASCGTMVAEMRIQFADMLTKCFVFAFTNENADGVDIEDDTISTSGTTLTISADDFVGFWFEAETTAYTTSWHGIYKGGTTTEPTLSTEVDFPLNLIVAGDWQILRIEIDPDGTARWYIDGTLLQTVAGACSTTEDLAVVALLGSHSALENAYIDYISVSANRDWTV